MDIYLHAKFSYDPLMGFFSPYARNLRIKNVYSASFGGSSNAPQPRPPYRFSRTIRQTTWFRARMCFFGYKKN